MQREGRRSSTQEEMPLTGMRICALVSNDTSRDSRVKKECAALVEAGAQVTLVGFGRSYPGSADELPYRLLLVKPYSLPRWLTDLGRETTLYPIRVAVNTLILNPYRKKMFASVRHPVLEALRNDQYDAIHANDFDMLATGAALAQRNQAKLVYDSHEIFLAPGLLGLKPKAEERFRREESRLLQQADGFITVNPKIGEYLSSLYEPSAKPVIIYNGSTTCVPQADPAHQPLRILFLGGLRSFFHFPQLIGQMARYRGKIEFTLQGHGDDQAAIRKAIEASDTQDFIRIIPPVDTYSIVDSSKDFDLGLLNSQARNLNEIMCSPNKLFDYLSAGLGIVASSQQTFIRSVIEETGCGFFYDQQCPEDLFMALDYLIGHPEEVSEMKRKALATAPRFSWDAQKPKLIELYSSLR
ncbi:MAG: glycosyltransferase [Coriobacteriia bacterium]|nr:glycosyltransferase [Coriobacteriia bacterium]